MNGKFRAKRARRNSLFEEIEVPIGVEGVELQSHICALFLRKTETIKFPGNFPAKSC